MHAIIETLDIHEVAALCRAEPDTIAQYARSGVLPGTKMGKGWVFLRDDVITFLRERIADETRQRRAQAETRAPDHELIALQVAPAPRRRRNAPPVLPTVPAQ
jgi:hypothetical protein